MTAMMKCGHAATGTTGDGVKSPVCITCVGLSPDALTVVPPPPLEGRLARCAYKCKTKPVSSSVELAFFEHKPNSPQDEYYCGCCGWD